MFINNNIQRQLLSALLAEHGVTTVLEEIAAEYAAKDNIAGAFVASTLRDAADTIENILGENHEQQLSVTSSDSGSKAGQQQTAPEGQQQEEELQEGREAGRQEEL